MANIILQESISKFIRNHRGCSTDFFVSDGGHRFIALQPKLGAKNPLGTSQNTLGPFSRPNLATLAPPSAPIPAVAAASDRRAARISPTPARLLPASQHYIQPPSWILNIGELWVTKGTFGSSPGFSQSPSGVPGRAPGPRVRSRAPRSPIDARNSLVLLQGCFPLSPSPARPTVQPQPARAAGHHLAATLVLPAALPSRFKKKPLKRSPSAFSKRTSG